MSNNTAVLGIIAYNIVVFAAAVYLVATDSLWWLLLLICMGAVKIGGKND